MKRVVRIDSSGFYIEPVIIQDNETIPADCVEEIPEDGLFKAKYINNQWVEGLSQNEIDELTGNTLENARKQKIKELDQSCNEAILAGFKVTLDDVEYEFSYDMESQSRFNGVGVLFLGNKLTEIPWTAYVDDERVRVTLSKDEFDIVSIAALNHQNDNIIKFNQLLVDVNNATKEELEKIVW